MSVRPLAAADRPALLDLLRQDPVPNVFLLGLLEGPDAQPGAERHFHGIWSPPAPGRAPALEGVVFASSGGLVVPWCPRPEDAGLLATSVRRGPLLSFLIGPRAACDALWEALGETRRPRAFYDQRLYVCEAPSPGPVPRGFRRARPDDAAVVADMASRMMMEDLGFDPAAVNPHAHRRSVERRITQGRTWIVEEDGRATFKIDVGTSTRYGAMVGGTYVPPEDRGRGLCTEGMRAVAQVLLRTHPRVTLHVNERNLPATRCYAASGFRPDAPFRLVLTP